MNDFMKVFFAVPEAREFLRVRRGLEPSPVEGVERVSATNSVGTFTPTRDSILERAFQALGYAPATPLQLGQSR
jgi:hypothetical protein